MAIMISDINYSESWVVLMTNSGITQVSWKDSLRKVGTPGGHSFDRMRERNETAE